MKVYYCLAARESIWSYYKRYRDFFVNTASGKKRVVNDLEQRGDKFREIERTLGNIGSYINQTYKKNGKNYIEIDNIGVIEYQIPQNKSLIVIKNICFSDKRSQNTNQQSNNFDNYFKQPQIQYKRVSQESFGLTRVQSNDKLFNFVDKNGNFFYHRWFKQAEDFKQWNKYVAARVFDERQWYFLRMDNKLLYPTTKIESRLLKKKLLEQELQDIINYIERFLLERNKRYTSKKNISPSLLKEHRLFEERFSDYKEKRQLKRIIRRLL